MTIKIVIPKLYPQVRDTLVRELMAQTPILERFGGLEKGSIIQNIELIELWTYNTERPTPCDILLTFEHLRDVDGFIMVRNEREVDVGSMVGRDQPKIPHKVAADYVMRDRTIHPPILRALAVHLGIRMPNNHPFREYLGRFTRNKPLVL